MAAIDRFDRRASKSSTSSRTNGSPSIAATASRAGAASRDPGDRALRRAAARRADRDLDASQRRARSAPCSTRLQLVLVSASPAGARAPLARVSSMAAVGAAPRARSAGPACSPCRPCRASSTIARQSAAIVQRFSRSNPATARRQRPEQPRHPGTVQRSRRRGCAARAFAGTGRRGAARLPAALAGANASMRSSVMVKPAYSSGASRCRCAPAARSDSRAAAPRRRTRGASASSARDRDRRARHRLRHALHQREPVQQRAQVLQRRLERQAALGHAVGLRDQRRPVAARERFEQVEQVAWSTAPSIARTRRLFHLAAAVRDRLIEQAQRVAHAALRGARDAACSAGASNGNALLLQHVLRSCARICGGGICFRLNCRQRDSTVTGIFCGSVVARMNFTCAGGSSSVFSIALKAAARQHVHFVDDVHLEAAAGRRVQRVLQQLAHVVDLRVRGRVELDQVDEAPAVDLGAGAAHAARLGGDAGLAVQRLGDDARERGLADAARAGEQIGVVQALLRRARWSAPAPRAPARPVRRKLRGRHLRARTWVTTAPQNQ